MMVPCYPAGDFAFPEAIESVCSRHIPAYRGFHVINNKLARSTVGMGERALQRIQYMHHRHIYEARNLGIRTSNSSSIFSIPTIGCSLQTSQSGQLLHPGAPEVALVF